MPEMTHEQRMRLQKMNVEAEIYSQESISNEQMQRFLQSREQGGDAPAGDEESKTAQRIVEMMKVDLESAEILKSAFPDLYEQSKTEVQTSRQYAELSGGEKMRKDFFGSKRRAARNAMATMDEARKDLRQDRIVQLRRNLYSSGNLARDQKRYMSRQVGGEDMAMAYQAQEQVMKDFDQMSPQEMLEATAKMTGGAKLHFAMMKRFNAQHKSGDKDFPNSGVLRDLSRAVTPIGESEVVEVPKLDQMEAHAEHVMVVTSNCHLQGWRYLTKEEKEKNYGDFTSDQKVTSAEFQESLQYVQQKVEAGLFEAQRVATIPGFYDGTMTFEMCARHFPLMKSFYLKYQQYIAIAEKVLKNPMLRTVAADKQETFFKRVLDLQGIWGLMADYTNALSNFMDMDGHPDYFAAEGDQKIDFRSRVVGEKNNSHIYKAYPQLRTYTENGAFRAGM